MLTKDLLLRLIFEGLSDPLAELGCAGPPYCKDDRCSSNGEHDVELTFGNDMIRVLVNNDIFTIEISAN